MQYDAFSYPCLDQLITHVGRYHWRSGGKLGFPITIRMPYGGGVRAPELHDDSPEAYYVHTPGIKVAIPSTPADAKGLLAAAIRDPDPVVIFEPKLVYRTARGEVPEGEYLVPLGQARIAREGTDVTLIAYGAMVGVCERAADELDVSCEIVDIRSLRPLDESAILASVAKTGRVVIVHEAPRTAGFGAELAALIAEKAIFDLQGPILRVTGYDVPYPYWTIEDEYMPSVERVAAPFAPWSANTRTSFEPGSNEVRGFGPRANRCACRVFLGYAWSRDPNPLNLVRTRFERGSRVGG